MATSDGDQAFRSRSTVVPTLRYRDGHAAIIWLKRAFGFSTQLVIADASGAVAHAQLTYGDGMIMLGAAAHNEFHSLVKSPLESGNVGSQSVYIMVTEIDAHHAKAVAAGGAIVIALKDADGGRGYSCRDPGGHIWNFGTYDPWTSKPT